jgi:hypothetical protein
MIYRQLVLTLNIHTRFLKLYIGSKYGLSSELKKALCIFLMRSLMI